MNKTTLTLTMLAALSAATFTAPAARADDHQSKKNTARNLGIGAAAIAGYGLLKGNKTATILGAAGAAVAAKNYEDNRKAQSRDKHNRDVRHYRRTHRSYRAR